MTWLKAWSILTGFLILVIVASTTYLGPGGEPFLSITGFWTVISWAVLSGLGTITAVALHDKQKEHDLEANQRVLAEASSNSYLAQQKELCEFANIFGSQESVNRELQRRAILLEGAYVANIAFQNELEPRLIRDPSARPEEALREQEQHFSEMQRERADFGKKIEVRRTDFWGPHDLTKSLGDLVDSWADCKSYRDFLPENIGTNHWPELLEELVTQPRKRLGERTRAAS